MMKRITTVYRPDGWVDFEVDTRAWGFGVWADSHSIQVSFGPFHVTWVR
jgi:hypothetical protein